MRRTLAGFGFLLLPALLAGVIWLRPAPPTPAFHRARAALGDARHADAATYVPKALAAAETTWATALNAWQHENQRWFLLRDYQQAQQAAETTARLARHAATRALTMQDSLRTTALDATPEMHARLADLKRRLARLPYLRERQALLTRAEQRLAEATYAFAVQDYQTSTQALYAAHTHADSLATAIDQMLASYLAALPTWQQWRDETVAWSARRRAPALMVDKLERRCYVYVAGRLRATYPVELGPHWMGDKRYEGDDATPEGRYRITRKLGPGTTRYHRALLIDYPNGEDRQRFDAAKAHGALPRGARIGGLIELHGHGGRGADWTNGCIALTNADIEILFRSVPVGTPVTIVGALEHPRFDLPQATGPFR